MISRRSPTDIVEIAESIVKGILFLVENILKGTWSDTRQTPKFSEGGFRSVGQNLCAMNPSENFINIRSSL